MRKVSTKKTREKAAKKKEKQNVFLKFAVLCASRSDLFNLEKLEFEILFPERTFT